MPGLQPGWRNWSDARRSKRRGLRAMWVRVPPRVLRRPLRACDIPLRVAAPGSTANRRIAGSPLHLYPRVVSCLCRATYPPGVYEPQQGDLRHDVSLRDPPAALRAPLHRDGRRDVRRHGSPRRAGPDGARRRQHELDRARHRRDAPRDGGRDDGPDGRVDALPRSRPAPEWRDGGRDAAPDLRRGRPGRGRSRRRRRAAHGRRARRDAARDARGDASPPRRVHARASRRPRGGGRMTPVAESRPAAETEEHHHHELPTAGRALDGVALSATLHCLTGCAIGEIAGMVIGTALGLSNWATVAISVALAFAFGYSLTSLPLLRAGLALAAVVPIALASDTLSIAVMEVVDNAIVLAVPGALDAGLGDVLFWGSLTFALAVAGAAAFPVNRRLIARGRGHAAVHRTGIHGGAPPAVVGALAAAGFIFGAAVLLAEALG